VSRMTTPKTNKLVAERRAQAGNAPRGGGFAFPNDFRRDALAGQIARGYGDCSNETLEAEPVEVRVGGRLMAKRVMGKASFAKLQDRSGQIQLFLQRDALGETAYTGFKALGPRRHPRRARAAVSHQDRRAVGEGA
jgi:lysyl-tRNA synthetase class 2